MIASPFSRVVASYLSSHKWSHPITRYKRGKYTLFKTTFCSYLSTFQYVNELMWESCCVCMRAKTATNLGLE